MRAATTAELIKRLRADADLAVGSMQRAKLNRSKTAHRQRAGLLLEAANHLESLLRKVERTHA